MRYARLIMLAVTAPQLKLERSSSCSRPPCSPAPAVSNWNRPSRTGFRERIPASPTVALIAPRKESPMPQTQSRLRNVRQLLALPLLLLAAILAASVFAPASSASSTLQFSATFTEVYGGPNQSPLLCPDQQSACGHGEVIGLGQVSEYIYFNACGPGCDLRTITFPDGSTLVTQSHFSNGQCPGGCRDRGYGFPYSGTLTEVVRGDLSTGEFAGATGTLSGHVHVSGGAAIVTLSGSIALRDP
jgi:hypothetical protein